MDKSASPTFKRHTFTPRDVSRIDDIAFMHPLQGIVTIPGFSRYFIDGGVASILPENTDVLVGEYCHYPKQYREWLQLPRAETNSLLAIPEWCGSSSTRCYGMFGTYNLGQVPLRFEDFLLEDPIVRERRRRSFIPDPVPIPVPTLRITEPMLATHARIKISTEYIHENNDFAKHLQRLLDYHCVTDGVTYSSDGCSSRNIFIFAHLDEGWQEIREAAQAEWDKLKTSTRYW